MGKFEAKELLKKEGAKVQEGVCAAVASNSCFKSNLHSRAPKSQWHLVAIAVILSVQVNFDAS